MAQFTMPVGEGPSTFRAPLSGDVTQTINPWTWFLRATGLEIGQLNVYLGTSTKPELERQILDQVGTYGRQIGQIGDALAVVLRHTDLSKATEDERRAIVALQNQLATVDSLKRRADVPPLLALDTTSFVPPPAGGTGVSGG